MTDLRKRIVAASGAAVFAILAGVAAGCGAAGVGLGSLGLAIGAFVVYLALAAGAGPGCYASHPDEDTTHVCLSYMGEDGEAAPDAGPCLEPPADARDDGARDDVRVCLSEMGPDDGRDGLPLCPPELCDVCLESPIDWCILECPPPDAGGSAAAEPRRAAQQRLASAGVLSPEQLARLRRLQGRKG